MTKDKILEEFDKKIEPYNFVKDNLLYGNNDIPKQHPDPYFMLDESKVRQFISDSLDRYGEEKYQDGVDETIKRFAYGQLITNEIAENFKRLVLDSYKKELEEKMREMWVKEKNIDIATGISMCHELITHKIYGYQQEGLIEG